MVLYVFEVDLNLVRTTSESIHNKMGFKNEVHIEKREGGSKIDKCSLNY